MRLLIVAVFSFVAGCRSNPACFGTSECEPGTVCFRNECVDPRDADAGVVTFWQDVEPILAARCQTCHASTPLNGAPFALEDYGDTQGEVDGVPIHRVMAERVSDDGNPMPPRPAASLSPREQELIQAWTDTGANEGLAPFSWNEDVEPLVADYCRQCHANPPINNAPMPLMTYEDTQIISVRGRPIWEAMGRRTNSPMVPMPPTGALDMNSRRIFRVWAATGAPERPAAGVVAPYDGGVPMGTSPLDGIGPETVVSSGYGALEGLAWDPVEGVLYFADAADNTIRRLTMFGSVDVLRSDSQGSRGLRVDRNGDVVAAESAGRIVSRQTPGGANTLVADRFRGNRFNSPANVAVSIATGNVYFTDPPLGVSAEPRELPYAGLFRVSPEGSVFLEWEGPNGAAPVGLTLSPDENQLYVADRIDGVVRAFDVSGGGELVNERVFAFTGPGPQGITVDRDGNVYVAVAAGIEIYGANGGLWGLIAMPMIPTDVAFGGDQLDRLYVSAADTLYSIPVMVPGTAWGRTGPQPDAGPRDTGPDGGPVDTGPRNPVSGAGPYTFIQGGFRFLDGPEWVEADQELLFCDWGPGGDVIYQYSDAVSMFRTPGQQSAGLSIDPTTGDLIAAEMDTRRVTRTTSDGTILPVVETYQGNAFNGPNDVIVKSDGTLYFTDPPYGLMGRTRFLAFNGLFRVSTGSTTAELEWQGDQVLDEPNGIALSPDETLLYVVNSSRNEVVVFDVMPNDALANRRQFAPTNPIPDGMAVDADGNVYITTRDGIQVFRPDGTAWGAITNPGPGGTLRGTNLTFGGSDLRTVYVTTPQELYRFQGAVPGVNR